MIKGNFFYSFSAYKNYVFHTLEIMIFFCFSVVNDLKKSVSLSQIF